VKMAAISKDTGYVPMYKLKPYQTDTPIELPKVMFTCKPYHSFSSNSEQASTPLGALEQRQEAVLERLQQLKQSVDTLKGKYNIQDQAAVSTRSSSVSSVASHVKSASIPDKGTGALDLVISADPSSPPLSLVVLCGQLAQRYHVLFNTYVHSSASDSVPDNLGKLGTSMGLKRADAQLVLNLVWKKEGQSPKMMVDPTRQTPILGEANIARYLTRLLEPGAEADIVAATQRDELLDLAQLQIISGNTKEKAAAVRNLNSSLGKNSWLTGSNPNVVDVVVWSALQQTKLTDSPPANVKKWLALCSKHQLFSGVTALVS